MFLFFYNTVHTNNLLLSKDANYLGTVINNEIMGKFSIIPGTVYFNKDE